MTSTTTASAPGDQVLDHANGELLDVREAPTDRLARFLEDSAELAGKLGEAKSAVEREVLRRMDADASWTAVAGEFELQAPSPEAGMSYYEVDVLHDALVDLGRRGVIGRQAARAALKTEITVERKAQRAGVKALLSLGGEVAAAVAACERRREQPPRRTVRVRRARQ
ncbi:MAG: hypothetical protein MSC31_15155 [Solirubrobacteraceae bacterium MAG38_C4-C5]|nr:hypothetical protein [Candidatus Siliceabacter maunaloa]